MGIVSGSIEIADYTSPEKNHKKQKYFLKFIDYEMIPKCPLCYGDRSRVVPILRG
jgi:hypothetical protein